MAGSENERWWAVRRAQNRKPATYTCPLCGSYLPALSEHMLLAPEGDSSRRRHAHAECVLRARRQGRLPTRDEWLRAERAQQARGAPGRPDGTPAGTPLERLRAMLASLRR